MMVKWAFLTAFTSPEPVLKVMARSLISKIGRTCEVTSLIRTLAEAMFASLALTALGIKSIANGVAKHDEAQDGDGQGGCRIEQDSGVGSNRGIGR